jgi:hypothetical protein
MIIEDSRPHPFIQLSDLIDRYRDGKNSFDVKELQTMREDISLCLFYLSDSVSVAISNFDKADWDRKRNFSKLIEENKCDSEGKKNTVSIAEALSRVQNEPYELEVVEAIRQKERVRIIISATQQILNAISSRLSQISK